MKKIRFGALSGVLTAGCCTTKDEIQKLDAHTWQLTEMNNVVSTTFKEGENFTIRFSAKDSTIAGVGACNRFFGRFEVPDCEKIDIKMGGSTMMACPGMEIEQPFFQVLEGADGFKFDDKFTELELLKYGKVTAKFKIFDSSLSDVNDEDNSSED